ncbi:MULTISPECIES: heme-binding domain-containing protein [unclassified Chryseobacterium]|uniref:heme-binding domain-containing protein n=1 Tax=unclassified Chryseobacterium TaxID=2593645 RepID=UPI000E76AF98|nr:MULTISPECIES: heme-binding domain-containing protein [unclassified Chryseobacterium]RKE78632.1 heme-binding protein [Chryseobacterium sp. AG363]WNI35410.1 heme-binding domain-containing protein [Chryseobacterium sp. SG20098]
MKQILKRILVFVLFLFIAIQLYQPAFNIDKGNAATKDFIRVYKMPAEVQTLFRNSCYDCHSNNTDYVWYDYIQPVRSVVESHIKEAKNDLNFNEWETYSNRKQERLLNSIKEQIVNRQMPLSSYTLMHRKAKLSDDEIKTMTEWLKEQSKVYE